MKIYLIDINKQMVDAWKIAFKDFPEVGIINDTFENFMNITSHIDGIVSPANSFGLMDGGYDKAIIDYFGKYAQHLVSNYILEYHKGYQPVGSCSAIDIGMNRYILHTPTMRIPSKIEDHSIIFDCMMSCLCKASNLNLKAIVIPAFGACTGGVPKDIVAKYMAFAYFVFKNKSNLNNWEFASYIKKELNNIMSIE